MDFKGKQGREELPVSPEHEMVLENVVKVSLLTSVNNNLELGKEALIELVTKVLEEVFEARVKVYGETLQARHLECNRKRITVPFKSGGGVGLELCG
ncbi:hypothetical protein PVK06_035262 [Gossypium arboreum]|uniref:Uncharacterized protein n=1 Tax=Gossypium arboreum TaxID=29729 RepID=A0ABR0NGX9_GOSAR|nr:hypothetical protein PVK06_035262 [Gossypium arboreum]